MRCSFNVMSVRCTDSLGIGPDALHHRGFVMCRRIDGISRLITKKGERHPGCVLQEGK